MNEKLRSFVKSKNYLFHILLYVLILSLLPISIIGIIYLTGIKTSVVSEAKQRNAMQLTQCVDSAETLMAYIRNTLSQSLVLFGKFEDMSNCGTFETSRTAVDVSESARMSEYFNLKANLIKNLASIKNENDCFDSLWFYDRNKDMVINNRGEQYTIEDMPDKGWLDLYTGAGYMTKFFDTRQIANNHGTAGNVITIVFRTFNSMDVTKDNLFVVNIDENKLYNYIFKGVYKTKGYDTIIVSGIGSIIFSNDKTQMYMNLDTSGFAGKIREAASNDRNIVSIVDSQFLGWKFYSICPINDALGKLTVIGDVFNISMIVAVFCALSMVAISSIQIYSPIKKLISRINPQKSRNIGEIEFIGAMLNDAFVYSESLKQKLLESMPYYKEKLVSTLLRCGGAEYSENELNSRLAYIGMEAGAGSIVLLMHAARRNARGSSAIQSEIDMLALREIIGSLDWKAFTSAMECGNLAAVVTLHEGGSDDVFKRCEELCQIVRSRMEVSLSVGISEPCACASQLPAAYRQAEEALRFMKIDETGGIIHISDVRTKSSSILDYPAQKESLLAAFIKNGDKSNAQAIFDSILDDIASNRGAITFHQIQRLFFRLLVALLGAVESSGLDVTKTLKESNLSLDDFGQIKDFDQYITFFNAFIASAADETDELLKNRKRGTVEEIIEYLQENYASPALSLSTVAGELNLNPGYVSRVFKKRTNKSFVDYLMDMRIELGKRLLVETDDKIETICTKVGYHNSYYFIKVFKELTGMTPGEYRRQFYARAAGGEGDVAARI